MGHIKNGKAIRQQEVESEWQEEEFTEYSRIRYGTKSVY